MKRLVAIALLLVPSAALAKRRTPPKPCSTRAYFIVTSRGERISCSAFSDSASTLSGNSTVR